LTPSGERAKKRAEIAMTKPLLVAVVLTAVLLGGCGKKKAGGDVSCEALGVNLLAAWKKSIAENKQISDETRHGVETMAVTVKDQMVKRCKDDAWPAEVRACLSAAGAEDAKMRACADKMPRDLAEKFKAGIGGTPAPADRPGGPASDTPDTTAPGAAN
jgi:hypothetical protein